MKKIMTLMLVLIFIFSKNSFAENQKTEADIWTDAIIEYIGLLGLTMSEFISDENMAQNEKMASLQRAGRYQEASQELQMVLG